MSAKLEILSDQKQISTVCRTIDVGYVVRLITAYPLYHDRNDELWYGGNAQSRY